MRQAGYEITWITNQQTQTARNTMLTALSQMADHQVYLNNNRRQDSYQLDGAVLQPFAQALASAAPKKMIIVHLLGTHRKYTYRYPKSFQRFTLSAGAPRWVNDKILAEYNSYDNAVLYNDYVVSELIGMLDREGGREMLLYFADHGEEVYDTPDALFSGRNESKPTPAMYTVPFVLWGSNAFISRSEVEKLKSFERRPYGLADFIYTWSEVAGLNYAGFDATRSLVSEHFIERPRRIGDPAAPDPRSSRDTHPRTPRRRASPACRRRRPPVRAPS
jgi:heptose-I-phosphate ethanolaminephosphotransferase